MASLRIRSSRTGPVAVIAFGAGKIRGPRSGAARQGERVHKALSDASIALRNWSIHSFVVARVATSKDPSSACTVTARLLLVSS